MSEITHIFVLIHYSANVLSIDSCHITQQDYLIISVDCNNNDKSRVSRSNIDSFTKLIVNLIRSHLGKAFLRPKHETSESYI